MPIAVRSFTFKTFFNPEEECVASERPSLASAKIAVILFFEKSGGKNLENFSKVENKELLRISNYLMPEGFIKFNALIAIPVLYTIICITIIKIFFNNI